MTEITILIPDPTPEADLRREKDAVEFALTRCRLPRCQKLLRPGLEFCDDAPHRQEFHNKFKVVQNYTPC
jgi:hypothetical protein